jgi:hypothetical protein
VHILNGTTAFIRLPFYDQDSDQIPRWWEQLYANGGAGMSDTNAGDATTDLDGDTVNNRNEYLNRSNPLVADTDGDGLTDAAEINTWHTNPAVKDTDGEGLSDYAEVITYHTDPLATDSDADGYNDIIEVLYGGDPNDVSGLPTPLSNYSMTFEGSPNLAAFYTPTQSGAAWAVDSTTAHAGTKSYKSGTVAASQTSSVRFRGLFRPGTLSFWAKVDPGYCCNNMYLYVDGTPVLYISSGSQWTSYDAQLTLGVHELEWRFQRDSYGGQPTDAAWIDDISFIGQ